MSLALDEVEVEVESKGGSRRCLFRLMKIDFSSKVTDKRQGKGRELVWDSNFVCRAISSN